MDPLLGKSGTYLRILVKVARVAVVVDFGHDGRLQFAVVDVVPIEALEPTVALHVFGTVLFRKKKKIKKNIFKLHSVWCSITLTVLAVSSYSLHYYWSYLGDY